MRAAVDDHVFRQIGASDSRKVASMSVDRTGRTGFAPNRRERVRGRRCTILAQLIAITALAVSIAIAATAVSIGIARADVVGPVADDAGSRFAVAILFGLVLIGMGGLTAFITRNSLLGGE